jgi:ParB-like chromosome segregation protein Spo0J
MYDSIREFGFRVPVLATSKGDIIDGHLRWKAAQRMKLELVPVILCDDWSDAQIRAFRLLVNRSVTWAEWDLDLLSAELAALIPPCYGSSGRTIVVYKRF